MTIAAVDKIKLLLYTIFSQELLNVNIGYELNTCNVHKMINLVNIIDYIEGGNSSSDEIISILQMYE